MKCPNCGKSVNRVLDSRPTGEGMAIRRRRECLSCLARFTSYEFTGNQILPNMIRENLSTVAKIDKIKASIEFLSMALKALREGTEALIENVDKIEKDI